jgi:hypothetical protein
LIALSGVALELSRLLGGRPVDLHRTQRRPPQALRQRRGSRSRAAHVPAMPTVSPVAGRAPAPVRVPALSCRVHERSEIHRLMP